MNYYNNLRDKQQHCILTRFSTFSHDNGCLFQIVSVMWKDNSVPQLWLALMHDVSIISCLQLFAWWPENVTFRTLEKGALKKMLTLFPFFKICSISCCFFLVSPVSLLFACYLGLSKLCRLSSTFAIMSRSVRNVWPCRLNMSRNLLNANHMAINCLFIIQFIQC